MGAKKPSSRAVRQSTERLDRVLKDIQLPKTPRPGWIKVIREALSMSQKQLAQRMNISQQAIHSLEGAEADGSITLARLRRAADGMGCEVAYVLVPRKPLSTMVSEQAHRRAVSKMRRINHTQALEASSSANESMVNDLALEMMLNRPADLWDE